jgi:hypothetical protein
MESVDLPIPARSAHYELEPDVMISGFLDSSIARSAIQDQRFMIAD